jgi:hypothetical protein
MFSKKFVNCLLKALAWTTLVCSGLGIVYAVWAASQVYSGFGEAMGVFIGCTLAVLIYGAFIYSILAVMFHSFNKD